jgi:enoyl-CoA hydratase
MSEDSLLEETRADGVALLTLNRPAARNALSRALRDALVDAMTRFAENDAVGAVVLTGAGETFSAGFDLKELSQGNPVHTFADAGHYHAVLHEFPKPLIAAVNGHALAGGMDLAALCDVRLAMAGAEFGQPQVRHGIPAAYGLMRSVLPEPTARLVCLSGRRLAAPVLLAQGFLAEVHDDVATLMDAALALAGECAASPSNVAMKAQAVAAQPTLFGAAGAD